MEIMATKRQSFLVLETEARTVTFTTFLEALKRGDLIMAEASKLQVSELDFAQIRENFKTFLSTQDQFKDYDTDGSIMSVLLDLLSITLIIMRSI